MKIEKQVCNLEQSKKLKRLGVNQDSRFFWIDRGKESKIVYAKSVEFLNSLPIYSAFNVAELGKLLPPEITHSHNEHSSYYLMMGYSATDTTKHLVYYEDNDLYMPLEILHSVDADTEALARAEMLKHLLENKLIEVEACNERLLVQVSFNDKDVKQLFAFSKGIDDRNNWKEIKQKQPLPF